MFRSGQPDRSHKVYQPAPNIRNLNADDTNNESSIKDVFEECEMAFIATDTQTTQNGRQPLKISSLFVERPNDRKIIDNMVRVFRTKENKTNKGKIKAR